MTNPDDNALVEAVARAIAPLMLAVFKQANMYQLPYSIMDVRHVAEAAIEAADAIRQQEANNGQ